MTLAHGMPEIRFSKAGPFSKEGVCPVEKMLTFKKTAISGTSNDDFFVAPAGVFVTQAFIRADVALDGTAVVTLGTDGNADALIDATDFSATTINNSASNMNSTTAVGAIGLYLAAGDTLRLAITGSPTVGALSGYIKYVEMAAIMAGGVHFDLT